MNLKNIVEKFAEVNIEAHEAIIAGDVKSAKKFSDADIYYWKKIKSFGDEGKEELSKLFCHPHPSARLAAAASLLKYKNDEAIKILTDLAKGKGLVAFEASEALKRCEEGSWYLE